MKDRELISEYCIESLIEKWHKKLILRVFECIKKGCLYFCIFCSLLLFIMNHNLTFAQEFQVDSILLERKTITKNDREDISVIKKVFVKNSKKNRGKDYEGYCIESEYWLLWNYKLDSLQLSIDYQGKNFNISSRQLQNKINVAVLEYSEIVDPSEMSPSTNRVFQIINLDNKSILFYTTEQELITFHNGGTHGNYRHNYDTSLQEYSLTFDNNDNVILTHIKNEFHRGMGEFEKKKTMPKRIFTLTYEKDRVFYMRKYDN